MPTPCSGLLVIETASVLAGPLVGQFFAELGARVIKIENPLTQGDVTRHWKTANEDPDQDRPAYFSSVNWGKESLCLDLSQDRDQKYLSALLSKADIWIDNLKPGAWDKLGLTQIADRFPRLIQGRINAYGEDSQKPGYDAALQADTGLMSLNGTPQSGPLKFPLALVDILAAHQLKQGLLLALLQRQQTGKGDMVSVSLQDSGVSSLANQAANYLHTGHIPKLQGSEHPNIVPYGTVYLCEEGKSLVLAVGTDRQFRALCEILGLSELIADSRFIKNTDRVKHRQALNQSLMDAIAGMQREALLQQLEAAQVPAAAIHDMAEVLDKSQHLVLGKQGDGKPVTSGLRTVAFESQAYRQRTLSEPPRLDQHREKILQELAN